MNGLAKIFSSLVAVSALWNSLARAKGCSAVGDLTTAYCASWVIVRTFTILIYNNWRQHMNRERKLQLLRLKKEARKNRKGSAAEKQEIQEKQAPLKQDDRFERVSYDPRFARVPKQIQKVKIDKRFNRMMTDDRFKLVTNVDKYGRKIVPTKENQQLKDLYYPEDEMEEDEEDGEHEQEQSAIEEQAEPQTKKLPKGHDKDLRDWMENYDEQSDESSSPSNPEQEVPLEEVWSEDGNVVKGQQVLVTKRLALCNYQWMNYSARDLMVVFNSFKPIKGFIQSVTVYPSELGLERLKQEEAHGPNNIWNENAAAPADRPVVSRSLRNQQKQQEKEAEECIDPEKLRAYQRERLRYYYAVIECDSKETADEIYKTCDSRQLENAGQIDLRFIPDDLQFPHEPSDFCDELPSKVEIKQTINRAMGHSKVNLTWQDPELNTIAGLKKKNWGKMTEKEMDQVDWSLYIDNDGLSEDEEKNKQPEQADEEEDNAAPDWKKEYHAKSRRKQSSSSEEMEITFNSGFDLAGRIKQKKEQGKLSSYELYKKKSKEKRAEKNIQKQEKRKQQQQQLEEEEIDEQKRREHLELLVEKEHQHQDFKADVNDTRFTAVYNNPLYGIDPTSHHFKVTKNTKLLGEVVRRKRNTSQ